MDTHVRGVEIEHGTHLDTHLDTYLGKVKVIQQLTHETQLGHSHDHLRLHLPLRVRGALRLVKRAYRGTATTRKEVWEDA